VTDLTRVPVVVGAGQFTNRDENPATAPDPFELMVEAATRASADAAAAASAGAGASANGSGTWLSRLTHCWMVHSISLRHGDPAAELARRINAPDTAQTRTSGMGGNIPQWLVNRAAELVRAGERPIVLIAGAEALATKRRARRTEVRLGWPSSDGWPDMWPPLEPDMGVHPLEDANGLRQATTMYALVESAIANTYHEDPATHRSAIGNLMEGLNAVAVDNPYSWFPTRRDAQELVTATTENRMISTPYPKYLNAVMDVDMSAAVLVTDAETARAAGLAPDAVAYLRGWADAYDVWYLSQRPAVDKSPALDRCVQVALEAAGLGSDDLSALDLYSCFPSSIEVARGAFGIPVGDERALTLTGGLPYHGGPGSNYVTHAVCNALDHVRSGRGPVAVHGNGYYLTKHAIGVYSADAPGAAPEPAALPTKSPAPAIELDQDATGAATITAWTVPYGRDGAAETGIVIADVADGRRTIARADESLTETLLAADRNMVGRPITVGSGVASAS
jgi:acetyl-CoA C-acetyltransferase